MKNIFITMISVGIILSGGAFAFAQNTSVSNPPNTSVSNPPNPSVSNPQNIKLKVGVDKDKFKPLLGQPTGQQP